VQGQFSEKKGGEVNDPKIEIMFLKRIMNLPSGRPVHDIIMEHLNL
jgi:hypothetical protein